MMTSSYTQLNMSEALFRESERKKKKKKVYSKQNNTTLLLEISTWNILKPKFKILDSMTKFIREPVKVLEPKQNLLKMAETCFS